MEKVFITTAIDYTNDVIHIGHAYQKIIADAYARFHRIKGDTTFLLTGTDEYGTTNQKAAEKVGKEPQKYVDEISGQDKLQYKTLEISYDRFIRTTDADHFETVKEFYQKVYDGGDIYKGTYEGLYCEGCEAYKTLSELKDGKCPLHPTREIAKVEEENYFFKWSKYRDFLLDHISKNPTFILPSHRASEMLSFLKSGLEDIPISRPNYKVSWGMPLPNDPKQTIYVWFDALINYYTGAKEGNFWSDDSHIIHILGKDNLRWHALLWPAMLKSASLRLPDNILTHSFINLNGQKVSKSLGNIIRPDALVSQFGADAIRYFFLKYGPANEDVDISVDKIKQVYNSELANDWGNLVSRVAKLSEGVEVVGDSSPLTFSKDVEKHMKEFSISLALHSISERVARVNEFLNEKKPWEKKGDEKETIQKAADDIRQIAYDLCPFMPHTSDAILKQFTGEIKSNEPYFKRIA